VIEFVTGNLLDAEAEALVNTVNTKGVMGKGIALQFKRAFPENFKFYRAACAAGRVELGRMLVFDSGRMDRPRYIINFPTKDHWRSRSRLADIEAGLGDLRRVLGELEIESVAVPPLGCGLGGLRWADIRPRIERALGELDARVLVYEPHGAPAPEEMRERRERPRMTAFRATLVWLLSRYLAPGESASPLEVQKLLYFLQEAGEPLKLRFEKQRYGPYADGARHAVVHIEGHYLTGFGDGTGPGDVHPLPGAVEEAESFLAEHPETRERYDRVVELIDGFETPYGLELLATTHWVATREGADTAEAAGERVRDWSQRKQHLFTDEHVAVAWERLDEGGWLAGARVPAGV
jgi:O-acetyl-ADP-ribose deacetylase (regulator of RNase III)